MAVKTVKMVHHSVNMGDNLVKMSKEPVEMIDHPVNKAGKLVEMIYLPVEMAGHHVKMIYQLVKKVPFGVRGHHIFCNAPQNDHVEIQRLTIKEGYLCIKDVFLHIKEKVPEINFALCYNFTIPISHQC